jgi:hypothetical protein
MFLFELELHLQLSNLQNKTFKKLQDKFITPPDCLDLMFLNTHLNNVIEHKDVSSFL